MPAWVTGEWKQAGSLVVYDECGSSSSTTPRNQNDSFSIQLGQLQDKAGHVWHYGIRQTERPMSKENRTFEVTGTFVTALNAENLSVFKLKSRSIKYLTKKVDSKPIIEEVKRSETTYKLRLLEDAQDTLTAEIQTREFGDNGQQSRYTVSLAFWRRSKSFQAQSRIGQKDLLPLLTEYFRSTGQRSLIPSPSPSKGIEN